MLFICKCDGHDRKTVKQCLASFQFSEESCTCRNTQLIEDLMSYELRGFVHNWILLLHVVINMGRVDAYWIHRYCFFKMYFDV